MDYICRVLERTAHNGFPVVRDLHGLPADLDPDDCDDSLLSADMIDGAASRPGPLVGLILRSQLLVLLKNKVQPLGPHPCCVRLTECGMFYWHIR